jgi:acyl-CoA thioesterase-1
VSLRRHPTVLTRVCRDSRLLALRAAASLAARLFLLILILAAALFVGCSPPHETIANLESTGTTIVCFGDSITAGYGVAPERSFPALLAGRLDMPVIDAGVEGDTTADALLRIDRDVYKHDPRVVVVEFGGNDFLRKVSKEETFRNLDLIVRRISEHGPMVVLLEIRTGVFRDEYLAGYKRVAQAHGALLIPNFMAGILGNPKLTVDGIHPNEEGHELIAERVLEHLGPLLEAAAKRRSAKQ